MTGLKSGHYYNVRAIATNAANFSTLGPLIRLRTTPPSSTVSSPEPSAGQGKSDGQASLTNSDGEGASVRNTPSITELLTSAPSQPGSKEHNSGHVHGKRVASSRRNSPAAVGNETSSPQNNRSASSGEDVESDETIPQLTKKLDSLRRQQEEIDRQIVEEEQEFEKSKTAMLIEQDGLRQILKEKEEAFFRYKKEVEESAKLNRTAQRKKSAKERLLHQKRAERQKMKDDIERWDKEIVEMRREREEMEKEKAQMLEKKERDVTEYRKTIEECQAAIKIMEEDIREKGFKIKALERERKKSDDGQNEEEQELERTEREKEQAHEARIQEYQAQYAVLWQALQSAEAFNQQAQDRLAYWTTKRAREPEKFASISTFDLSSSAVNRQRKIRQGSSRASTVSYPSSGYPSNPTAFNSISGMSPTFSSASPFFSMGNGMVIPPSVDQASTAQQDADAVTGGAPMSPTANSLLPSNLLHDDDPQVQSLSTDVNRDFAHRTAPDSFPSHRAPSMGAGSHGPHSPVSATSRSPSLFSSPRDSLNNLHSYYTGRESSGDTDRRSLNSSVAPFPSGTASEVNPIGARGFAGLFNFNRQRGKSTSNEPPSLGTLKQGQSQSFPRKLEEEPLGAIGTERRRGSYGAWASPMANFLARNNMGTSNASGQGNQIITRTGSGRRSRLNMFGPKLDPIDPSALIARSSSPRPSSTYSFENALPRPSTDTQPFGWPVADSAAHRGSPIGTDWASVGGPWSRSQSRRPSAQQGGSTSNLSLGSTPLEPDDYQSGLGKQISPPAPIARPRPTQRPVIPKLNPTAPSFKTRLFSRNEGKRASKPEKTGEQSVEDSRAKEADLHTEGDSESLSEDNSPLNRRVSRDAYSVTTDNSIAESHNSLEQSTSNTPSENVTPSGSKGTLIQRITRKGSSSKFNVPWVKDKSGLFSKKAGEPSTPDEVLEDPLNESQLSKSVDSNSSTPQHDKGGRTSISWPNIIRKSRRGDRPTTDSSEIASETGDDDNT